MKPKNKEIKSAPNNIINALKQGHRLTTIKAMSYLGTTKLLSRISDLRREGWNIVGEWKKDTNRYGRPVRFKIYRLARPFRLNKPYRGE